jgi:hypothetical protein
MDKLNGICQKKICTKGLSYKNNYYVRLSCMHNNSYSHQSNPIN